MRKKRNKLKISTKELQRGSIGSFFVYIVLIILIIAGISAVGGLPSESSPTDGKVVAVITPTSGATGYSNLQLKTFGYITLAPTPTLAPPPPYTPGQPIPKTGLCQPGGLNREPEDIAATVPKDGQSVGNSGQIKIWVLDEGAPIIANGETTNADGSIANKGNQYGIAKDRYLYEPAVYLDSSTAESGGKPYFPNYIKGQYDNTPEELKVGYSLYDPKYVVTGAAIDPLPAGSPTSGCINSSFFPICYKAEYIWNVSSLGLSSGTHRAEFVVHDGDQDRGIGCINIQIQ